MYINANISLGNINCYRVRNFYIRDREIEGMSTEELNLYIQDCIKWHVLDQIQVAWEISPVYRHQLPRVEMFQDDKRKRD